MVHQKLLFTTAAIFAIIVSAVCVVGASPTLGPATSLPTIDCSIVLCKFPNCEPGQIPEVPERQCCPVCVPDCSAVSCLKPVCENGQQLVIPEGKCCPQCVPECSAVSCLLPVCSAGEKFEVPDGECCPQCVPNAQNCSAMSCLKPLCQEGEELVTPVEECCPECQPVCEIQGQTFSTCASACPLSCDDLAPKICLAVCVVGCACPFGQVIDNVNKVCVTTDECPDPCATVRCANGYQCEVYKPTGEAFCNPNCSLNNGGCPADQECQLQQVQCVRAPCPPIIECVSDCPPTCSKTFCSKKANRRAMCSNPGPREIPGCTGPCQLTYCHTCHYNESSIDPAELEQCPQCEDHKDYQTNSRCFRQWAKCVRKSIGNRGQKLEENFKCLSPPCPLRG